LKMENLYQIIGVPENAGDEEIRKAFRMLAKKYHPDISKDNGEKFRHISRAYKILSNPEARSDYDRTSVNFRKQTGDFSHYTKNSYTVQGSQLKKMIKEMVNQGRLTDLKISYKGKTLFDMSFPVAAMFMMVGIIKAPLVFLIAQLGLSSLFEIEMSNPMAILFNEAVECHNLGRIADAERLYKKILERSEYFMPAYLNLGILYRQRGEDKKAIECFRQVLETVPYGNIGDIARKNLTEIRGF